MVHYIHSDAVFRCDFVSPRRHVNRFTWNFWGVYGWPWAIVWEYPAITLRPEMRVFQRPEVQNPGTGSRKFAKSWTFHSISIILRLRYFDQERHKSLSKIFAPYVIVYGHARTKMILDIWKNQDMTLITKTDELFIWTLFDFRFRRFPFSVVEKRPFPVWAPYNSMVYSIYPQSFIQIGTRV